MKPYKLHISKRQLNTICREMDCSEERSDNLDVRDSRIKKNSEQKSTWTYKGEK